jgi:hypothetical protein
MPMHIKPSPKQQDQNETWLNSLPRDVKAKLAALCRHYGEDLRKDLAEIVRAYYVAKKLSASNREAASLDQSVNAFELQQNSS